MPNSKSDNLIVRAGFFSGPDQIADDRAAMNRKGYELISCAATLSNWVILKYARHNYKGGEPMIERRFSKTDFQRNCTFSEIFKLSQESDRARKAYAFDMENFNQA